MPSAIRMAWVCSSGADAAVTSRYLSRSFSSRFGMGGMADLKLPQIPRQLALVFLPSHPSHKSHFPLSDAVSAGVTNLTPSHAA
jgi:hypothetical protein